MSFPNAAKGMRYVFVSEIVELLATLAISIISAFVANISTTVISIAGIVTGAVSLLLCLYGLNMAKQDEANFADAYYTTLGVVIAKLVLEILVLCNLISSSSSTFGTMLLALSNLMIVEGIRKLYALQGNMNGVSRARRAMVFFIIYLAILLASAFLVVLFASGAELIAMIVAIVALVCAIVSYIIYLILLDGASKDFA